MGNGCASEGMGTDTKLSPDKFDVCIYHKVTEGLDCTDGFAAAWVAHLHSPDIKAVGLRYDEVPSEDLYVGKSVIVVDICFSRKVMLTMFKKAKYLVLLDHHKTAMEKLKVRLLRRQTTALPGMLGFAYFDMSKSGALLAWEYLFPDKDVPLLIQYVSDHDLWEHRLESSREFDYWLQSHPKNFFTWDYLYGFLTERFDLVRENFAEAVKQGKVVRDYVELLTAQLVHKARRVNTFFGEAVVVNSSLFPNELGDSLSENKDKQFVVIWWIEHDRLHLSFRSKKTDVSEVAKCFKGGGHEHSSGAVVSFMEFSRWNRDVPEYIRDVIGRYTEDAH